MSCRPTITAVIRSGRAPRTGTPRTSTVSNVPMTFVEGDTSGPPGTAARGPRAVTLQLGSQRRGDRRPPSTWIAHRGHDIEDRRHHEFGLLLVDVVPAALGDDVPAVRHEPGDLLLQVPQESLFRRDRPARRALLCRRH